MRAFTLDSFGSADALALTELDKPEPAPDEVLVRVRATSVNPYDWHNMRGEPRIARIMSNGVGFRKPRLRILGCDVAGEVVAVGSDVAEFAVGDEVFALVEQGAFAEYVAVPGRLLARKPTNLSFEQAAAVPMAAVTALLAVRDDGQVAQGDNVLVTGASGGVGSFAVQLAVALGGTVTGVSSTRNLELVRSIGAVEAIDYTKEDFTTGQRHFDVLIDCAGSHSARAALRAVDPRGALVVVGGEAGKWVQPAGYLLGAMALAPFVPQRVAGVSTSIAHGKRHLETLTGFIASGSVTPVIDRVYPFDELPDAIRYQEAGHVSGKVVVTV